MGGSWGPHPRVRSSWIYSDASVHRIISDLSAYIGHANATRHRTIAAGDLNLLHGYGGAGDPYWEALYRSVFERMRAIGLEFVGPQAPHGRPPTTPPVGQPADSRNVGAFAASAQSPANAVSQLDYAFASGGFHERIKVRALNEAKEWAERPLSPAHQDRGGDARLLASLRSRMPCADRPCRGGASGARNLSDEKERYDGSDRKDD